MSKKQAIIIFPHLNDCGGDLSQKWYVEYRGVFPGKKSPGKSEFTRAFTPERRKNGGKQLH